MTTLAQNLVVACMMEYAERAKAEADAADHKRRTSPEYLKTSPRSGRFRSMKGGWKP